MELDDLDLYQPAADCEGLQLGFLPAENTMPYLLFRWPESLQVHISPTKGNK